MPLTAEKLRKLPQWAQDYIGKLEFELRTVREAVNTSHPDGRMEVLHGLESGGRLAKHVTVRCYLSDNKYDTIDVYIRRDEDRPGTFVLDVNGNRRLAIEPRAANAAWIRLNQ